MKVLLTLLLLASFARADFDTTASVPDTNPITAEFANTGLTVVCAIFSPNSTQCVGYHAPCFYNNDGAIAGCDPLSFDDPRREAPDVDALDGAYRALFGPEIYTNIWACARVPGALVYVKQLKSVTRWKTPRLANGKFAAVGSYALGACDNESLW